MKKPHSKPGSFRSGLTMAVLICWILPVIIVTFTAIFLLDSSYTDNMRRSVDADLANASQQVELRLLAAIEDSKAVSYEGTVRQAYRTYGQTGIQFPVYRTVSDYLNQKFTHSSSYRSAFISFWDDEMDILPYAAAPEIPRLNLIRDFTQEVLPEAKAILAERDTGIVFLMIGDRLYMIRNLLDTKLHPYAILSIELDPGMIFQSMKDIDGISDFRLYLDDVEIPIFQGEAGAASAEPIVYSTQIDGHSLQCSGELIGLDIWNDVPMLRWAILLIILLVLPMLLFVFWLFYRNLSHPVEVLIDANSHIQGGERGFQITEAAPNSEFQQLYRHFNTMSNDLRLQFERLYEEQIALQQAKIKALQSQINPHFLNNTLEIINWEARLADNERVCSMIEALSVMLDAAIGRDGRSRVQVCEEMKYVDAYLYITQERLGDRMVVQKSIEPEMLHHSIPLLMLQPIVENAVEHSISKTGGELCLRAFTIQRESDVQLCFEIEHDGRISPQGWADIRRALDGSPEAPNHGTSVGLRNVANRLRLLYGDHYTLEMTEVYPGRIMTQIILPAGEVTTIAQNQQAAAKKHNQIP